MAEVKFRRESLERVRASGVEALLERHWEEVAHYKDIPLSVAWGRYEALEEAGNLRIFAARVNGELVGYSCYMIAYNGHYSSSFQAVQDVLFLAPEHRKGRIGYKLIAFADQELAAEGVQAVYQHEKKAHPALGKLLERMGYEAVDVIWAKRLDH